MLPKNRINKKNRFQNMNVYASQHLNHYGEPLRQIHSKIKIDSKSKSIIPNKKPQQIHKIKEVKLEIQKTSKQSKLSREKSCKQGKRKKKSRLSNTKTISNTRQFSTIKQVTIKQKKNGETNPLIKIKLNYQKISSKQNLFSTIDQGQKQSRIKNEKFHKTKASAQIIRPSKSQKFLKSKEITQETKIFMQQLKQYTIMKNVDKNKHKDSRQQLLQVIEAQRIRNIKREQQIKNLHGKEAKRLEKIHMIERQVAKNNIEILKNLTEKQQSEDSFGFCPQHK